MADFSLQNRRQRKEPSIEEALKNLLHNDELSDITLQSNDGRSIPAIRGLLASRSVVFHKMLFGPFAEAKRLVIPVEFPGVAVQAVIEHIYTNQSSFLAAVLEGENGALNNKTTAETLVSIASCASFFDLPTLYRKVSICSLTLIEKNREIACHILEASRMLGLPSEDPNDLPSAALRTVQEHPSILLDEGLLVHVGPSVLEEILKGDHVCATELELFEIIRKWSQLDMDADMQASATSESDSNRQQLASDLARNIRFNQIHPSELSSVVAPSGLLTQQQLLEAYKLQAMSAAEFNGDHFTNTRCYAWENFKLGMWRSDAERHETKLIDCPVMVAGQSYQWTMKVVKYCGLVWVGIASTLHPPDRSDWLGSQQGGWVYGNNGSACHEHLIEGKYECPFSGYNEGDEVTLILDLSSDNGMSGTLSARVNDGERVELFSSLNQFAGDNEGFLPAASLKRPGCVQLVKFKKLT